MEKLNLASPGRWLSLACASLGMLLFMPRSASAQSTLTWARVELTRNQVQLFTNGQGRRARVSDVLGVGDALSTARRARAELRFNDGSLARIGESAVFQFTPDTRNFRLSNGTVLLLVPPGQGRTTIQTPNAVTGIHGSALFVRFIPETDTTIIGALTNNADGPMMAFNQDGTQQQPLYAGEMAVLRGNRILERFDFELETFYETSDLVVGLQLEDLDTETGDQAIDAVRQEIQDALEQQERFDNNSEIIDNPSFISANPLSANRGEPLDSTTAVPEFAASPAATFLQQNGIDEGFTSAVSGTIHRPTGDQVPTATGQPNPQPSVAKPPTPAPQPTVVKPPTPTPAPAPAPALITARSNGFFDLA
ncbi:MAG: FecR domain-containing protein, partial [Leptolyngbyaceae cyanobacterium MAG.088]|nr:FecR domain-containing protein [Leptolyngbyaceae cyanobacterium MAG.088]